MGMDVRGARKGERYCLLGGLGGHGHKKQIDGRFSPRREQAYAKRRGVAKK